MAGDPYFSNVKLLLHMDGTNGGTVFTDSSASPHTMEPLSGASTSTAQKLFGTASFNANASRIVVTPAAAELQLGASDFTVEIAAYLNSAGAGTDGVLLWLPTTGAPTPLYISYNTSHVLNVRGTDDAGTQIFSISTLAAMSDDVWHRICIQRSGSTFRLFLDGVSQGTASSAATLATFTHDPSVSRGLSIGGKFGVIYLDGFIDEFRYTVGTARYGTSYTPDAAAFANNGAPNITVQPANQSVAEPSTATFSVTAVTSGGALTYQWYRNTVLIGGATSSSYTTPANTVASNNGDVFKVTVTDNNDTVTSNNATLTVTAPLTSFLAAYTDPNKPFIPLELWLVMHSIRTIAGYNKGTLRAAAIAAYNNGDTWIRRDSATKQYYARRPKYN